MPEYPQLPLFDSVGDTPNILIGSPLASATTIALDHGIHHVTGTSTIQTITIPWTGFSGTCYLIADNAWSLGTAGNINSAVTVASGNIVQITYDPTNLKWYPALLSSTGGVSSILPFVADNTGAGDGVITGRKSPSGSSITSNFFSSTGTLPTVNSATTNAVVLSYTSAGSSAFDQVGIISTLSAGYTGSATTTDIIVSNKAVSTGVLTLSSTSAGMVGANLSSGGGTTTVGDVIGAFVTGRNNGGKGYALIATGGGIANTAGIGIVGATSGSPVIQVGGRFQIGDTIPTFVNVGLSASNGSVAAPIFIADDNGTAVFTIDDGGNVKYLRTVTAGGTTGNQTIDKPVGTVNFAAGASVITVTNALVVSTSIVFGVIRTADATATFIKSIVSGAGSFVITLNANATAETSVGFMVTN